MRKKNISVFYCKTATEANDRANLYYIASPTAAQIQRDTARREIQINSRNGRPLAVFQY